VSRRLTARTLMIVEGKDDFFLSMDVGFFY
jgi:hypothetical protein